MGSATEWGAGEDYAEAELGGGGEHWHGMKSQRKGSGMGPRSEGGRDIG